MGASKSSIFLLLTLVSLQRFNLSNFCLSPLNMDQTPVLHSIAEPSKNWGWQGPLEIAQSNLLLKAGPLIELCRFLSNLVISSKGNGTTYSNVYFFSCCTILPYHMAFLPKLFASLLVFVPMHPCGRNFWFSSVNYISGIGKMWLDSLKTFLGWTYPVPSILCHLSSPTILSSYWRPFRLQVFGVFLEVRSPNLDLVLWVCPNKCQMDWSNHSFPLADCPLVNANVTKFAFPAARAPCWNTSRFATHQDHPSCAKSTGWDCCIPGAAFSIYLC